MNGDDSKEHFGKMDAKVAKGIAIFLMLAHHVWAFPTRTPTEYPIIAPIIPITFHGREFFQAIGTLGNFFFNMCEVDLQVPWKRYQNGMS